MSFTFKSNFSFKSIKTRARNENLNRLKKDDDAKYFGILKIYKTH